LLCVLVFTVLLHAALEPWSSPEVVETETETEFVTEEEGNPFMLKCQSNILITESLWSCWVDQRCNLDYAEITMMYITYKGSVIMCKRAYMFEMFQKVNVSKFLEKRNGNTEESQTKND